MPFMLSLPNEYAYVLAAASSTFFMNSVHGIFTGMQRKKSGITYPTAYASDELAKKDPEAMRFNCTQRAHANFIENQPTLLGAMMITGLRYPVFAASLGAVWTASRFFYLIGYRSDVGPKGRVKFGIPGSLAMMVLQVAAAYTSAAFIFNW